ncbi:MAG: SDR family oxidoreductase [Actinomycetota bacterium]|nr:SDR family oxidoreductase [Actinomycetota bacterium]
MGTPQTAGSLAVVTGGSSGIGRAVAVRLLAAGNRVIITGRRKEALEEAVAALSDAGGAGAEALAFDVTDEAAVNAALGDLAVDVLVNNAGYGTSAPLERTSLDDWSAMLAVHATGPFLCTRAVLAGMKARDFGRIITVSSVAGLAAARYIAPYVAGKHAGIGLMRATAAEVTGTGVTANAICPGYVDTPMTDTSVANIAATTGRGEDAARSYLKKTSPLGRLITADEVAAAVAYLASPEAAAVNGQTLVLDGGGIFG